jgi:hypothetical protein
MDNAMGASDMYVAYLVCMFQFYQFELSILKAKKRASYLVQDGS